jgi:peptide/nickel transport system ATP-binding protein
MGGADVSAAPLLRVDDLTRWFDVSKPWLQRVVEREPRKTVRAVENVDFSIPRGSTLGLVGESGCGKSTVARLVAGLEAPTRGAVTFHPPGGVALQMVFQDPSASLNPRWRIGASIAEPMPGRLRAEDRRKRTVELLDRVGLPAAAAGRYPHEFSGGQRQRISIARALAAEAEFLILDEPTSALDVSVQAQILNLLKDLQAQLGLTYLFISHNLAVVRHLCDHVAVMYLGRIVEVGPAEAVLDAPAHPYTRLLIDTAPDPMNPNRDRRPPTSEPPSPVSLSSGCAFHGRCPHAVERCRTERPDLSSRGPSHKAACHL